MAKRTAEFVPVSVATMQAEITTKMRDESLNGLSAGVMQDVCITVSRVGNAACYKAIHHDGPHTGFTLSGERHEWGSHRA